jgi:hypothetical protein
MPNNKLIPTHFTCTEGAIWLPYKGEGWTEGDLATSVTPSLLSERAIDINVYTVLIAIHQRRAYHVHSLSFPQGRWDVYNGWNEPNG